MRILVVGAGATGGLFGGLLARAGRDVTFLVRAHRAEVLRQRGLEIVSPRGDFRLEPQLVQTGEIDAPYDLTVLGVKAFALESAIGDFAPAVGENTMILPLLNGMRHIDLLVERFGEKPVLGGVCIVASTLDDRGRIVQLNEMQSIAYGERAGGLTPRLLEVDATLKNAGFDATASEHIVLDMWQKWVFLATLAGSTCLLRGSIGAIVSAGGAEVVSRLFDECVAVAKASGYEPGATFLAQTRERVTDAGSPLTASMYRDQQQGLPVEADQILGDLLERARGFRVDAPVLAAAYTQLNVYQRARAASAS